MNYRFEIAFIFKKSQKYELKKFCENNTTFYAFYKNT